MSKRKRIDSSYGPSPFKKFAFQTASATLGYMAMNEIGAFAGWRESGKYFDKLTQMPANYQKSYEGIQDGIGSDNKTINLGGRTTARHVGHASWRTQYPGVLSPIDEVIRDNNGTNQTALTSGIQSVHLLGACMTIYDFVKATKSAPGNTSRIEPYINLFAMNPDSIATGSVDTGGTLIPALSWTQDYINWYNSRFIFDFSNASNNSTFVKIYVCKSRKDQSTSPEDTWNYDDQSFGQTDFRMNGTTSVAQHAVLSKYLVHTVPQSSTRFRQQWEVIGVKSCKLAAGSDCKIGINVKVNRTYSRQAMIQKVAQDADIIYPKGCVAFMAVTYGSVVNVATDPGDLYDGPCYGMHEVLYVATKIYNFGFTDKTDKYDVAWQGNNIPMLAALNTQKLMVNGAEEDIDIL